MKEITSGSAGSSGAIKTTKLTDIPEPKLVQVSSILSRMRSPLGKRFHAALDPTYLGCSMVALGSHVADTQSEAAGDADYSHREMSVLTKNGLRIDSFMFLGSILGMHIIKKFCYMAFGKERGEARWIETRDALSASKNVPHEINNNNASANALKNAHNIRHVSHLHLLKFSTVDYIGLALGLLFMPLAVMARKKDRKRGKNIDTNRQLIIDVTERGRFEGKDDGDKHRFRFINNMLKKNIVDVNLLSQFVVEETDRQNFLDKVEKTPNNTNEIISHYVRVNKIDEMKLLECLIKSTGKRTNKLLFAWAAVFGFYDGGYLFGCLIRIAAPLVLYGITHNAALLVGASIATVSTGGIAAIAVFAVMTVYSIISMACKVYGEYQKQRKEKESVDEAKIEIEKLKYTESKKRFRHKYFPENGVEKIDANNILQSIEIFDIRNRNYSPGENSTRRKLTDRNIRSLDCFSFLLNKLTSEAFGVISQDTKNELSKYLELYVYIAHIENAIDYIYSGKVSVVNDENFGLKEKLEGLKTGLKSSPGLLEERFIDNLIDIVEKKHAASIGSGEDSYYAPYFEMDEHIASLSEIKDQINNMEEKAGDCLEEVLNGDITSDMRAALKEFSDLRKMKRKINSSKALFREEYGIKHGYTKSQNLLNEEFTRFKERIYRYTIEIAGFDQDILDKLEELQNAFRNIKKDSDELRSTIKIISLDLSEKLSFEKTDTLTVLGLKQYCELLNNYCYDMAGESVTTPNMQKKAFEINSLYKLLVTNTVNEAGQHVVKCMSQYLSNSEKTLDARKALLECTTDEVKKQKKLEKNIEALENNSKLLLSEVGSQADKCISEKCYVGLKASLHCLSVVEVDTYIKQSQVNEKVSSLAPCFQEYLGKNKERQDKGKSQSYRKLDDSGSYQNIRNVLGKNVALFSETEKDEYITKHAGERIRKLGKLFAQCVGRQAHHVKIYRREVTGGQKGRAWQCMARAALCAAKNEKRVKDFFVAAICGAGAGVLHLASAAYWAITGISSVVGGIFYGSYLMREDAKKNYPSTTVKSPAFWRSNETSGLAQLHSLTGGGLAISSMPGIM